ncbi:PRA1 family protein H [Tripterygium wilfordii]|uniref:PRA1 family protein n=1 Tax=Tripterygium wilfordii TaxID=458696 RepID=A0A7J7C9A1_TRIWF|nr:PRA1 family protein H-like [Tripterygium wilfordii]KAF5730692.1 PRA1 family protein H [Tripterygium wilfordii]
MVFSANPLSLSVPDPAFDSWLRDSGYLDLLDHRSSSTATASTTTNASAKDDANNSDNFFFQFVPSFLSRLGIILSLLTLSPFSKLTTDDLSGETPSWTSGYLGNFGSYSFPSSAEQARLRVQENIKRYARNYASLFILFFACSLYQMPVALVGLLSSLALWDLFRFCSDRWGFERHPVTRQVLVRTVQCATVVILLLLKIQMAIFYALAVTYAVMMLHATLRKLTPMKQPSRGKWK